jgi:hypothetical protein
MPVGTTARDPTPLMHKDRAGRGKNIPSQAASSLKQAHKLADWPRQGDTSHPHPWSQRKREDHGSTLPWPAKGCTRRCCYCSCLAQRSSTVQRSDLRGVEVGIVQAEAGQTAVEAPCLVSGGAPAQVDAVVKLHGVSPVHLVLHAVGTCTQVQPSPLSMLTFYENTRTKKVECMRVTGTSSRSFVKN